MKGSAGYFIVVCGALMLAISATVLGIAPGLFSALESPGGLHVDFLLKLILFFVLEVLVLFAVGRLHGFAALASCDAITMMFLFLGGNVEFKVIFGAIAMPLLLSFAVLAYFAQLGKTFREMLSEIGIGKEDIVINAAWGVAGFAAVALLANGLIYATNVLGIGDAGKTYDKLSSMPFLFLIVAVTLAPVAEEVFFRGFLFRKYGYLASSAVFAGAHWFYGSWVQIATAFALGLAFCALFAIRKSLVPPMIAHVLYNASFVYLLFYY
jgi:membrane protease YdiL (CAAX protease family)